MTHILPKSIQINDYSGIYHSTSFIENLVQIFDRSITSFNEIKYYGSVRSSRFLKDIAKKVEIYLQYDKYEEEVCISEDDYHK